MIIYEWLGESGRHYRMATGVHAQHAMRPGQEYELQISEDRAHWIAMRDWNVGVRSPAPAPPSEAE